MGINLVKGQKIDLTKDRNINRLRIGLGWEPTKSSRSVDLDSSVFLLGDNDKKVDLIYYGRLVDSHRCIEHKGDNLTGAGSAGSDKENIMVNIKNVPPNIQKFVFVVNIYQSIERKQHFGMVQDAFIHIDDAETNQELCRFNLTEDYRDKTALIVGELYRHGNDWKFSATGIGTTDGSLSDMSKRYT